MRGASSVKLREVEIFLGFSSRRLAALCRVSCGHAHTMSRVLLPTFTAVYKHEYSSVFFCSRLTFKCVFVVGSQ